MVRSKELSSAKRQSVASDGLISKVAGSRWTSMSQAWCARIRPVRWLLKYMSTFGTASTNWIRRVSAAFWARAEAGSAAAAAVDRSAERRVIFTKGLLDTLTRSLGCRGAIGQASRQKKEDPHDGQAFRQGA